MADGNRQFIERYIREVWHHHDLDALARFLAPDYRRHLSPTAPPLDRADQIERLEGMRTAFRDVNFTLEDVLVDGDRVAFRSTLRGTHTGEFLGLAATGRSFTVGLVDIVRIRNGQIVDHWGGPDLYDLVRQLGANLGLDPHAT